MVELPQETKLKAKSRWEFGLYAREFGIIVFPLSQISVPIF
jgi:hypothetical protein